MLHNSIQYSKHITNTPKSLSRLLWASSMFLQKILTCKNLLRPSNSQTLVIAGRQYKTGQWSCLIACTKVFWMRSYAEVHLTLSSMTGMATKMKKTTQKMMHLCYHLTKKNNKATKVKTRMIKNENRKNEPLLFQKNLPFWGRSWWQEQYQENWFSFQIGKYW